jgi:phosphoribosylaminoimidazole-succinocarboxamide synthase
MFFIYAGHIMSDALYQSNLSELKLLNRGKVRDIYEIDTDHLLIVTSDRLSAFDVILSQPIPGKGEVLTRVSNFWFSKTHHLIPNQLTHMPLSEVIRNAGERTALGDRAIIVKKFRPLPIEAIVRGHIIGSGWKDYQRTGRVCGIELPTGLQLADRLPTPIYTPSTKAELGQHDENIDYQRTVELLGTELARQVRDCCLAIYSECAAYALQRGIIIADTKLEFGLDEQGTLHLIDEVLTPDSSRFWPVSQYKPGLNPPSFDKQFVRDYLETLDWNKEPPAPKLPEEILLKTAEKYREAERLLIS